MSKTRRNGVAFGLGVGAGTLLAAGLIPLAAAGAAWADDGVTGGADGGVSTPVGGGNVEGGTGVNLPNPFNPFAPVGVSGDTGVEGGVSTPVGGGNVEGGTGVDLPNPFNPFAPVGVSGDTGVEGGVNTPIVDAGVDGGVDAGIGR
ncbi:hypothetical protein [Mycolicibacterium mageritense]|nr:hypothetical protein [Mycolicibacterium mageritense]